MGKKYASFYNKHILHWAQAAFRWKRMCVFVFECCCCLFSSLSSVNWGTEEFDCDNKYTGLFNVLFVLVAKDATDLQAFGMWLEIFILLKKKISNKNAKYKINFSQVSVHCCFIFTLIIYISHREGFFVGKVIGQKGENVFTVFLAFHWKIDSSKVGVLSFKKSKF